MYFKQIDNLLSSVVDVTNQSQTIMFTRYTDGSMIAHIVSCNHSATDEQGLDAVVDGHITTLVKSKKLSKEFRLRQLQEEIARIEMESDFNNDI
jgi:hypothetical protein